MIFANPLGHRVRGHGSIVICTHRMARATLEPDLSSPMEKSDELVLASYTATGTAARVRKESVSEPIRDSQASRFKRKKNGASGSGRLRSRFFGAD